MLSFDLDSRCFRSPSSLRLCLDLALLCVLTGILLPRHLKAQTLPCADRNEPAIIYTGKTYGYLRNNDASPGSVGKAFAATYENVHKLCPQAILVGTGDNFAPEYGSRYSDFDPSDRSKTLNPLPRKGPDGPSNSPSVQFFKDFSYGKPVLNSYDALVPGQLDFFFGADFLLYVGEQLPLLAGNLTIKSSAVENQPQPLCGQAELLLPTQISLPLASASGSSGGSTQSGKLCLQAPSADSGTIRGGLSLVTPSSETLFPWSTEFEFSLTEGFVIPGQAKTIGELTSQRYRKYEPEDIDKIVVSDLAFALCPWNTKSSTISPSDCTALSVFPKMREPSGEGSKKRGESRGHDAKKHTDYTYVSEISDLRQIPIDNRTGIVQLTGPQGTVLFPGANVQLCVRLKKYEPLKCSNRPFHVQTPFFPHAWKVVDKRTVSYVLFGVLDPDIQGLISPENSSWGYDDQYTSQINIADPASVLEQLVTAFQKLQIYAGLNAGDSTYILLAHMQRAKAQALAATLRWHREHQGKLPPQLADTHKYPFTVILSAADYEEATPELTLTLDADDASTPVITPHPIVTEDKMRNPISLLEMNNLDPGQTRYINRTDRSPEQLIREDKDRSSVPGQKPANTFAKACGPKLSEVIKRILNPSSEPKAECDNTPAFQCLTLKSMRDKLIADVAILQKRDFYDGCNYEGSDAQADVPSTEMIERVLWNTGYLTRVSVSGTTLKSILEASDKEGTLEASSTNEPTVRGRELVSYGIAKSNGRYYINGAELEETKIYAIATSDQVALGDSAYPQFSQIDLVSPTVFTEPHGDSAVVASSAINEKEEKKETFQIAELAGHALIGSGLNPLDRSQIVAVSPWIGVKPKDPKTPRRSREPFNDAEKVAQNRRFLTITLQQASAGYTLSRPNQTDANINANLAGVTNPNVAAPHSDSLAYGDQFRLIEQWNSVFNFGFDELLNFSRSRAGSLTATAPVVTPTGTPVPDLSISLSANNLIASPFFALQPYRNQPHVQFIARPLTYSTNISQTFQILPTQVTTEAYELNLRRQWNWQPSIGVRYEWHALTYFEAGYLRQGAHDVLAALTVNGTLYPLTAGATPSKITGGITPNPGDVAMPTYKTFAQDGGYWLGMYTRRLIPNTNITYQGTTYGNFFAYGAVATTSSTLTRYAVELSNSILIPIKGNLSFAPSYNIVWFQNQSHGPGSTLTRRDWILQLNYSFDWHQGLEWSEALMGKANP